MVRPPRRLERKTPPERQMGQDDLVVVAVELLDGARPEDTWENGNGGGSDA